MSRTPNIFLKSFEKSCLDLDGFFLFGVLDEEDFKVGWRETFRCGGFGARGEGFFGDPLVGLVLGGGWGDWTSFERDLEDGGRGVLEEGWWGVWVDTD